MAEDWWEDDWAHLPHCARDGAAGGARRPVGAVVIAIVHLRESPRRTSGSLDTLSQSGQARGRFTLRMAAFPAVVPDGTENASRYESRLELKAHRMYLVVEPTPGIYGRTPFCIPRLLPLAPDWVTSLAGLPGEIGRYQAYSC